MSPGLSYCIPLISQRQFALNSRQRITFWQRGRPMQVSIVPAGEALCQLGGFEALSVGSVVRVLATWSVRKVQEAVWAVRARWRGRDGVVRAAVLGTLTPLCQSARAQSLWLVFPKLLGVVLVQCALQAPCALG